MVFAQCTEDWKAGSGNFHSAVSDVGKPPTRPFLVSVYYQLTITGRFPYNQFYKTGEQDWTDGSAIISTRCSFRRPRSDPDPCQVSSEPPPAPGI